MQIDLEPHEYKTGPRPNEPMWGRGWPIGLGVLASIIIGAIFQGPSLTLSAIGAICGVIAVAIAHQFLR